MEPGISFIVKIRNEEATLAESVQSLFGLLITYEILLILHRCSDASLSIARQLHATKPGLIRILTYNTTVARPGYETLVTDAASEHSLPTYYTWAHRQRHYLWSAKWDADFVAPPSLRTYLNTADIWHLPNQLIWLGAESTSHTERHLYFSSCLSHYIKHVFYEVPIFTYDPRLHVLHVPPVKIHHLSSHFDKPKAYWSEPPWFALEDTPESRTVRERYRRLVADFSEQPLGFGRSGSPTINKVGQDILNIWPEYIDFLL